MKKAICVFIILSLLIIYSPVIESNDNTMNNNIFDNRNLPPNKPATPIGETNCTVGSSYPYLSVASDPEGSLIFYYFDWDYEGSGWMGPYASGETINISHTWDYIGTYSVKVKAKDNLSQESLWSNPLIVTVNPLPEALDVNQSIFDRGFPIRHAADGDWAGAQSFVPNFNIFTRCELYLRKFGTPEFDLVVELRKNHPQGAFVCSRIYSQDQISSSWEWFNVNFNDIVIEPYTNYFIVIPPAPSGVTTSFGYEWGYAFGNQYDHGSFWFTRDSGNLWRDLPTMYEFVFRTYGYN